MRYLRTASIFLILFQLTAFAQNFWEQTNGPFGGTVYKILPLAGDSILAGTSNGFFISTDLGENWNRCYDNLKFTSLNDFEKFQDGFVAILNNQALIKISSSLYDTIYTSSTDRPWMVAVSSSGEIFLGTEYSLFSSTDGGADWIDLEDPGMNINYSSDIIFKGDTLIFYSEGNKIFRSDDDGQNWLLINPTFHQAQLNAMFLDEDGVLYAHGGMDTLYKSTDDGNSWEPLYGGQHFTSLYKDSTYFYAGSNQGIYRSTDGGYSWSNYSYGLLYKYIIGINNIDGYIFADTYGGGTYLLNLSNNYWEPRSSGIDASCISALIIDSENNVLAGTYGLGIQRQINDGLYKWEPANNGLSSFDIKSFAISSNNTVYTGTSNGASKSTDRGQTWTNMNSPCYNDAYGICVNSFGSVFIYSYCGVFRTTDDGTSWELMNSNIWSNVYNIASSPDRPNVYLSDANDFYRTTNNGSTWWRNYFTAGSAWRMRINNKGYIYILDMYGEIWRSTNSGTSFQNITGVLPSGYTSKHDIAFNSDNVVFLATESGLYESRDDGDSWILLDDSEISRDINVLYFNSDNYLYAGTMRSGVFRSVNILTDVEDTQVKPLTYSLSDNYPNPFNPSTKIRYSIPHTEDVSIIVYDILGKEASVLVNETKPAGQYEVEFNAGELSSGIYFCRMQTGSFTAVKKMILLK